MRYLTLLAGLVAAVSAGSAAQAVVIGSDAAACESGKPSIDVVVSGFKQPGGTLKVTLYDSDPARYLVRRGKLRNVIVPVRSTGPIEVCVAVPSPGMYAIALHHDVNGNDAKDREDGGGYSRNPRLTLFSLKPPFTRTGFHVGDGPVRTDITLVYVHGLSIGPVRG